MSLLTKFFGGKQNESSITPQEAIQKLRDIEETLEKKSDFIEKKMEDEIKFAKLNAQKNKRAALQALKRKKRLEKQLQQLDGTLSTIEFQREALENASTNTAVLSAMGTAAKALKSAHKNMDVDKVHDLMDEVVEQHEVANEIGEAISQPVGFGDEINEDELNDELESLVQEDIDSQFTNVERKTSELPEVPNEKIPVASSKSKSKPDEDDEMSQLAAWAT
ncbi:DgyrCDS3506 [Dimorphilus gyrociliatus]|uniref:DgyrCDS3506 n=1 Tax=Dimorphilus gyrociliatus TaxID=2664684 RepID=A0A7I8VEK8_9ANNE|nr:DgyrCDS3506 [Dimorphilus gyrociliatus]